MSKYYVYVMISRTPTFIGKVIRQVLDNKYNHMSISVEEDLSKIYSFGRVSARNSMAGGPLQESYYTMSLGGKSNVDICVFKIPVTKSQYDHLCEFINNVFYDVDGYVYNFATAVATIFHRQIKVDKCYTCIEFCIDALKFAGIEASQRLMGVRSLDEVEKHLKRYIIYKGSYIDYPNVFTKKTQNDEKFLLRKGFYKEAKTTLRAYKKLINRTIKSKLTYK